MLLCLAVWRGHREVRVASRCLGTFGFSEALCSSVSARSRSAGRGRDRRRLANAPAASLLLSASLASLVAASQQTKGRCAARSQTSARLHGSPRDVWRTRHLAAKQLAQKKGRGGTLLLRDLSSRLSFHTVYAPSPLVQANLLLRRLSVGERRQ